MSIDSIFLLSSSGEILGYKTYKGIKRKETLPEFYTLYAQNFKGSNSDKEYPIIRIRDALYAFVITSDILVGAIICEEIPVLQIYTTLFIILDILKGAIKEGLNVERLKANLSGVAIMLDSILDYGYPNILQKHVLESVVRPSGMIEKIEQAIVGRQNVQKENTSLLDKYIEGQADIRDHTQYRLNEIKGEEEVYFDVIEYLDLVVDKNGKALVEEINGEIKVDCNLSGIPELFVFLNQTNQFNDYTVHECLLNKIDTYEREKVLAFIPPSGSSTVFYYNIKGVQARVPFDFVHKITFLNNSARIEFKITNRPVRGQSYVVDEFHLKLNVPCGLCLGETELIQGSLQQMENALLWRIGKLEIDQSTKLVATYSCNQSQQSMIQQGNFLVCFKFFINQYSPSGTKIDKVEVRNGAKQLIKKARNVAKSGYYEIRLN